MKIFITPLLNYLVPPSVPIIYNEKNEPIESRAGPYEESGQLTLTCVVIGGINCWYSLYIHCELFVVCCVDSEFWHWAYVSGSPAPQVKWLENGRELQTEFNDFSYPSRASSKLVIKNLSRMHQHAIFTCQASNFPGKVVSANLTIELHCELKIHIQFLSLTQLANAKNKHIKFCFFFAP